MKYVVKINPKIVPTNRKDQKSIINDKKRFSNKIQLVHDDSNSMAIS